MIPTPEQMIREVVEATPGECWHDGFFYNHAISRFECTICNTISVEAFTRPSPDDLNAMFRLARKLGLEVQLQVRFDESWCSVFDGNQSSDILKANTPAEALLHALWKAVKK